MTDTAPDLDRHDFVTDAELIRRIGVPEKIARAAIQELDAKPTGFPRKQKLWGNRRYWPAVKAYFDAHLGLKLGPPQPKERHRG
jgi:hypothetical protein